MYDLPTSFNFGGTEYEIRSDYRAILDICTALSDPELDEQDRGIVILSIFYPDLTEMPPEHYDEAIERCFWFIDCGDTQSKQKGARLVDWEQDFHMIVAPVNRVVGREIRAIKYMHWWTFISAYMEIGDCTFAQIVRIRDMLAKGKSLDKSDREWYNKNRHLVDMKANYSQVESDLLKHWGVK